MAATMRASSNLSVASRSKPAARFARVAQRAVRPTSRSAVVVKAGEQAALDPSSHLPGARSTAGSKHLHF